MANDRDIKDLVEICDGHQSLIDTLITALSRVKAGEELELHQQPSQLLSRSRHFQIRINEMRARLGLPAGSIGRLLEPARCRRTDAGGRGRKTLCASARGLVVAEPMCQFVHVAREFVPLLVGHLLDADSPESPTIRVFQPRRAHEAGDFRPVVRRRLREIGHVVAFKAAKNFERGHKRGALSVLARRHQGAARLAQLFVGVVIASGLAIGLGVRSRQTGATAGLIPSPGGPTASGPLPGSFSTDAVKRMQTWGSKVRASKGLSRSISRSTSLLK